MINEKLLSLFGHIQTNVENNQNGKARLAGLGAFALETAALVYEAAQLIFKTLFLLVESPLLLTRAIVRLATKKPDAWSSLDPLLLVDLKSLKKSGMNTLALIPGTLSTLFVGTLISPSSNLKFHEKLFFEKNHKMEFVKAVQEENDPLNTFSPIPANEIVQAEEAQA